MTMKQWRKAYFDYWGTNSFGKHVWKANRDLLMFVQPWMIDVYKDLSYTTEQEEYLMNRNAVVFEQQYYIDPPKPVELVCCDPIYCTKPTSTDSPSSWMDAYYGKLIYPPLVVQEQKECTMYPTSKSSTSMPTVTDLTINMAPAASASVNTKSDVQIQREHLLGRLKGIEEAYRWGDKSDVLREAFNLDADNTPKTARQLIEAIKGGKFKLDDRIADLQDKGNHYDPVSDDYIQTPFSAIAFDGPTPDKDGYTKARETLLTLVKDAKDTIIVKSPEDGLTAIQALEAWTPTGKAN